MVAHVFTWTARPPRVVSRAGLFAAVLVLLIVPTAGAEISQTVTLETTHALTRGAEDDLLAVANGRAELDLHSAGSRYVRGRLQLRAEVDSTDATSELEIPRAFIKARFPLTEQSYFHLTTGRTRLTWGDGAFFNAGDTLFGTLAENPDFTSDTIRDETGWLAAGFFPLGRFSFVEPVVLVPLPGEDPATASTSRSGLPPADDTAAGLRVQGKISGLKAEASYLFRGRESYHQPAVSFQGHLGIDWYAGATTRIPGPDTRLNPAGTADAAREAAAFTAGLLHIEKGRSGQSLTLRLEGLVRPWKDWSESPDTATTAAAGTAGAEAETAPARTEYGLQVFPEIIWQPATSLQFYLRSVVSPIDASALIVPGTSWAPYNALTLSLFAAVQAGEVDDVYGWERPGGASVITSLRYVY